MLFLQSVRTTLNFRLRVATALSAHCPLVAESGITPLGASVAPYQRLVFNFLGVMENPDSFLGVIPKLSLPFCKESRKGLKSLVVAPGWQLCPGSTLPELLIAQQFKQCLEHKGELQLSLPVLSSVLQGDLYIISQSRIREYICYIDLSCPTISMHFSLSLQLN